MARKRRSSGRRTSLFPKTKEFNGKRYTLRGATYTKAEAKEFQKRAKRLGWQVRVIPQMVKFKNDPKLHTVYLVYVRKSK